MSGTGWEEESRRLRARSLSVHDLRGEDGHLVYLCSPLEQAVLQQLHKDLIWTFPGPELAPHLYSIGLISPFEHEQFLAKTTLSEKNEHLLLALSRRPAGVLEKLLSCLDQNDDIPGVKEIAKTLREKREAVEREGTAAPSAQKVVRPTIMVPIQFVYMLREENDKLSHKATTLEAKLKRFKRRVQRKLKEAMESSDDEDTDNDCPSKQVTNSQTSKLQEFKRGFREASDVEEDRGPTPIENVLQRYYSVQDLSSLTSDHSYIDQQTQPLGQTRYDVPSQQVPSLPLDQPDIGNPEAFNNFYTPNPPACAQNGGDGQGGFFQSLPLIGGYFRSDKHTTSKSATDSVGQLQPSSPRHIDSTATSHTPVKKAEISRTNPTSGEGGSSRHMRGQRETDVDRASTGRQSDPNPRPGARTSAKPRPPPKTEAMKSKGAQNKANEQTSQAPSSSGKTRSRAQLKYDQLNKTRPDKKWTLFG